MPPTVLQQLATDDFVRRMFAQYPDGWLSDAAQQPGGKMHALLNAIAQNFQLINDQMIYAQKTTRLSTAIDIGLDAWSRDFFGDELPRLPGEDDDTFRARIQAFIFMPGATKSAIDYVVFILTGRHPRLMEPWSPGDTACWDFRSFFDYDSRDTPARWGTPELRHQGFIETSLPRFTQSGTDRIRCFDRGAHYDVYQTAWHEITKAWTLSPRQLDRWISETKAWGTIVWRKFANPDAIYQIGTTTPFVDTLAIALSDETVRVTLPDQFVGPYGVIGQANWTTVLQSTRTGSFSYDVQFNTPAPAVPAARLDTYAALLSDPGMGLIVVPSGSTQIDVPIPAGFSGTDTIICLPNWSTPAWIKMVNPTTITIEFGNQSPAGQSIMFSRFFATSNGGTFNPLAGSLADTITIPTGPTGYQAFAIPNWNTLVSMVAKNASDIQVSYQQPAPVGAEIRWGLVRS